MAPGLRTGRSARSSAASSRSSTPTTLNWRGPSCSTESRGAATSSTPTSPPSASRPPSPVEAASRRWPVVIAIEDIHWADEGMLDLIDYMARWIRGPVLIVCLARDELLERRPGWGGGRRNYTTIALEPLTPDETRELV